MTDDFFCENTLDKLINHYTVIYGKERVDECIDRTKQLVRKYNLQPLKKVSFHDVWTHKDHILITYGDMVHRF